MYIYGVDIAYRGLEKMGVHFSRVESTYQGACKIPRYQALVLNTIMCMISAMDISQYHQYMTEKMSSGHKLGNAK